MKQIYELHFAPLQGCTDYIFRNAFDKYFGNINAYYTPFIRIEKGDFRRKDMRDIDRKLNTVSGLVPQILPGSSDELKQMSAMLLDKGYSRADVNMGCPFPLVAGKKKGSGMLPYPGLVKEVLHTIVEFPEVSFSVKMRLGWSDPTECLKLVDILNDLPLRHIMLHPRTGKQQYKGETDRVIFSEFLNKIKHPVIYNGDLKSVEDMNSVLKEYPNLKGLALGRGLIANPFLVQDFMGIEEENKNALLFNFHQEIFSQYESILQGETQLLMRMKSIWEYFLPFTDHKLLKQIKKANKISRYKETINQIFH